MRKLKLLLMIFALTASMGFTNDEDHTTSNDKYIQNVKAQSSDTIAPVIKFTDESLTEIMLVEGSLLNLSDWLTVTDNVGVRAVSSFGMLDVDTAGEYTITVMAADAAANVTTVDVTVMVYTVEEYEAILAEMDEDDALALLEQQAKYNAALQAIADALTDVDNTDIYALAETFVGMSGWCNEVAAAFLSTYYGYSVNIYNGYVIDASEAQPGDLVEYADGGNGTWHVAVYLGNGMALHGNWNGTTVISSIYVDGASVPYFVRLY